MASRGKYAPLNADSENGNKSKYVSDLDESREAEPRRGFLHGRRRYYLAGFAAILVISVVTLAAVFGTNSEIFLGLRKARSSTKITFEEAMDGKFSAAGYFVTWITDDTYLHQGTGIKQYNLTSNSSSTFLSSDIIATHGSSYKLSKDNNWVLFKENNTALYRHSVLSDYYYGRVGATTMERLALPGGSTENIRYATWCGPGSSIVFVFRNNIYYKQQVSSPTSYQITKDGILKSIFNGVPDWVYEEEILATDNALECSEDGKYLIFTKFNSSMVRYFKFTKYGPRSNAYTHIEKIAYPKPGYENPVVSLSAVNLDAVVKSMGKTVNLIPLVVPDEFKGIDIGGFMDVNVLWIHLIHQNLYRAKWPRMGNDIDSRDNSDNYYYIMKFVTGEKSKTKPQVYVSWMNRAQNHTITVYYNLVAATSKKVEEHMVKNGWVDDDYPKPKFSADGKYFINLLPKDERSAGYFRHVAKVSTEGAASVVFLTSGKWEAQDVVCFDTKAEIVYYRSTESSPAERHIYSVNVVTKEKKCVTCAFAAEDRKCSYYYPQFSKGCTWVNLKCQGPGIPSTKLRNLKNGKVVIMETNKRLEESLKSRSLPIHERYTVKSDGFDLPVQELRPPDFRPNKKYAVLFSVYGGPGTQKVNNMFGVSWDEFLVTNYDLIIVYFDARGCGYYGDKFLHAVYRQLGRYEVKDTNAVARHLKQQSYVDPDRISIWGWSYGGFYTASVLADPSNLFKVGISVAPVTDWRYYDTIYTERYMGLPTKADNLDGYEKTSVLPFVSNFKNKKFLLVHGTGDDNVHVQQSMQLANALVSGSIQFRMQIYPDRTHAISSHGSYWHLFKLLTHFIEKHLHLTLR